MTTERECHGQRAFPGRPKAGTATSWDWYWSAWGSTVPFYLADIGKRWAETLWTPSGPYIRFHYKLTDQMREETLAHELHHLARGGVCVSLCAKNEAQVQAGTARWLLPDLMKVADMLMTQSVGAVARELHVSRALIMDRIETATKSEQVMLADIMSGRPRYLNAARAAQPRLGLAV